MGVVDGRMLIPASGGAWQVDQGIDDLRGSGQECPHRLPDAWQLMSVRKPTNFPIY